MSRTEVDTIERLERWLSLAPQPPAAVFQGLDLSGYESALLTIALAGCQFFGCTMTPTLLAAAQSAKCLVYLEDDALPFREFRGQLYSPEELFAAFDPAVPASYRATPDWQIYLTYADPATHRPLTAGLDEILARRLHDNSISDALNELVEPIKTKVVAIMGGHDRNRSDPTYRAAALLAHGLTNDGYQIVSGGGPGIMEAANLGAFFASAPVDEIDAAIAILRTADNYKDEYWLARAWQVRMSALSAGLKPGRSIGIPTWFYGHEPPNAFASDIAKYFENSLREEGLLAIGLGGVVFAEGNGGTVQEIFQDACQNYYRTYGSATEGYLSPMVLLDETYWNANPSPAVPKAKPLFPLLSALAKEKTFEDYVLVTGPVSDDVVAQVRLFIREHPPVARS